MTPDRLKEIRALCDEITPAPWFNDGKTIWCFIDGGYEYTDIATIIATIGEGDRENPSEIEFNARFIAQSRQIIPELLDEIKRLKRLAYHKDGITYQVLFAASIGMADEAEDLKSENERLRNNADYLYAALETTLYALEQVAPAQYRDTIETIKTEIKGQRARKVLEDDRE